VTIKCPECDTANPSDSKYCKECAKPLPSPEDIEVTKTMEAAQEELTTGSTFGDRYQIIEELGKGGMGRVYRVLDKKLKEEIVLKLIKPEIASDKKTVERFSNELKIARKIGHKNVARMFDLNEEKGTHYITMEYVRGEDLKRLIRKIGQLSAGQAMPIAIQVCEGLSEAHRLGVVHRDLKPQNVMVDEGGNARIMDFGIARSLETKGITGAGVIVGTPEYMSPEQVEGKEAGQSSDIYSLGVMLYEMVTGKVPFKGDTPFAIGVKHKSEMPKDPKELNAQIPEDLSSVIMRCLEKDKDKRYQSAREVRSELENIQKGIPTTERVVPKRKPKPGIPRERLKPFMVPGIILLVAVIIFAGYLFFNRMQQKGKAGEEVVAETERRKMIVVLPFENLGSPDDSYFADGMTEEITSRLASVRQLGVISRQTAVQYDRTGKTIKQIGRDLGVDYALEGTVRWDRSIEGISRVRVTPQLIRVSDDTHLWSERYERVIEDIFAVQSEIAEKVISQLDITLLEPERRAVEAKPTDNLEAYHAYLRGMDHLGRAEFIEERYRMAAQMFGMAVELDPKFALAHTMLAEAHSRMYHFGFDRTEERVSMAKEAVDRALELQPDLSRAYQALGNYYYYCLKDYAKALETLSIAEKGLPNSHGILKTTAFIRRRQGEFREAIRLLKKALELSPQDENAVGNIGSTYAALREYSEAEPYFDRYLSLAPDQLWAYALKAWNYWCWEGETKRARLILDKAPMKEGAFPFFLRVLLEIIDKNYESALNLLSSSSVEIFEDQYLLLPKSALIGQVYHAMGRTELARASFDIARVLLEREAKERPEDARVHSSLGVVHAFLSQKDEAIRQGKLAVELYPVSKDAMVGPDYVRNLAMIYVLVGENEAALDRLEYLLSIPYSDISVPVLRADPTWDSLRGLPRFQKLLKKYSKSNKK
jgi:serine/threonine protein kinase/tetratricopeptide (TPR) repeat protein